MPVYCVHVLMLRPAKVTLSLLPGMKRFLNESKASLALSLNATTDEVRAQLMPHTKTWPIASLLQLLRDDAVVHPKREHFIEYVLFANVNDSEADADRLVALLEGFGTRINLIPHNPFAGSDLRAPSPERTLAQSWCRDRPRLQCCPAPRPQARGADRRDFR